MDKYFYKYTSINERIINKYSTFEHIDFYKIYLEMINSNTKFGLNWPRNRVMIENNINKIFKNEKKSNPKIYEGVLAYGQVQSGKTLNMIASLYYAYENDFKFIFVLTGNTDSLHKQTYDRFIRENKNIISFITDKAQNPYPNFDIKKIRDENLHVEPKIKFYDVIEFKEYDNNFLTDKLRKNINDDWMHVFFVKKDITWYTEMSRFAKCLQIGEKQKNILVMDDEADWGFESSSKTNNFNGLNNQLLLFKSEISKAEFFLKYVAFTATPYKIMQNFCNEFINENDIDFLLDTKEISDDETIEDVIKYEPYYCGIDIFHKNNIFLKNKNHEIVKAFEKKFVTTFDENFIDMWIYKMTILDYFANNFLYMNEIMFDPSKINGSFKCLIFPSTRISDHKLVISIIIKFLENELYEIVSKILKTKDLDKLEIEDFFDAFNFPKIFKKGTSKIQDKLLKSNLFKKRFFWEHLSNWILENKNNNYQNIVKFSESKRNEVINVDQEFLVVDDFQEVIFIGGNKISRGVTFENLTYETILHLSEKFDSTLQRARWFGFRKLILLKNMDIIMSEKVKKSFDNSIENDIRFREEIKKR